MVQIRPINAFHLRSVVFLKYRCELLIDGSICLALTLLPEDMVADSCALDLGCFREAIGTEAPGDNWEQLAP